jgi:hypothetical protein
LTVSFLRFLTPNMALPFNLFPVLAVGLTLLTGLACDTFLLARFTPFPPLRVPQRPWGLRELIQATAIVTGLIVLTNVAYAAIEIGRAHV